MAKTSSRRMIKRPYHFFQNSDFWGGMAIGIIITMLFCMFLYYMTKRDKVKDVKDVKDTEKNKKITEKFSYDTLDIDAHNERVDQNMKEMKEIRFIESYEPPSQPDLNRQAYYNIADDYFNNYIKR
jgi:hypothetical protein